VYGFRWKVPPPLRSTATPVAEMLKALRPLAPRHRAMNVLRSRKAAKIA
jgi:hypothetical protein